MKKNGKRPGALERNVVEIRVRPVDRIKLLWRGRLRIAVTARDLKVEGAKV